MKTKILVCLGILLAGYAIGKYTTPEKIVTKVEVKEVIKEVVKEEKNKQNDKVVVVVETVYPDGRRVKETKIVDKGSITVSVQKDKDSNTSSKNETLVVNSKNDWILGVNFNAFNYGIYADRRIIGPFHVGVLVNNDKQVSFNAGLSL